MKPFVSFPALLGLLGLLSALSISSPAIGQQDAQRSGDFAQGRNAERMRQPLQRRNEQKTSGGNSERQLPGDRSPDPQASTQKVYQGQGQGQGRERLSPEERRQLRRDINAAGRDIYRRSGP